MKYRSLYYDFQYCGDFNIWTKSYSLSGAKNYHDGSITTSGKDNLIINFASGNSDEFEFGKLEETQKLLDFLNSATTDSFNVSFTKIEEEKEEENEEEEKKEAEKEEKDIKKIILILSIILIIIIIILLLCLSLCL